MEFILPSEKAITLKSFPRARHLELARLHAARKADEQRVAEGDAEALERILSDDFFTKREAYIADLYPDLAPWDDLPNRDAQAVIDATWSYSIGFPEEEIKNWSRSGATSQPRTEPNTAEPAEPMQP